VTVAVYRGAVHITRLSNRPPIYGVAFVPRKEIPGVLAWRECQRLEEVRELLDDMGVAPNELAPALRSVYLGRSAIIRNVAVDEAALDRHRLRIPDPGSA
jgi:hypothetical protein